MAVMNDYACLEHGTFEAIGTDTAPCPVCSLEAPWTPSTKTAIHTPETHRRALLDWARRSNPI